MALGRLNTEEELWAFVKDRIDKLPSKPAILPKYLTASLPTPSAQNAGVVVYVSDAAAGSKVQYCDGASWIAIA